MNTLQLVDKIAKMENNIARNYDDVTRSSPPFALNHRNNATNPGPWHHVHSAAAAAAAFCRRR